MKHGAYPGTQTPTSRSRRINEILSQIEEASRSGLLESSVERRRIREKKMDQVCAQFHLPREVVQNAMDRYNSGAPKGARSVITSHFEKNVS